MATALALGALNQIQNIGQIGEIVQGQVHQKEQISWTRRGYLLDSQSLRLDALDHAKEEIKSHYDTYVSRIDTLLLVLALIWPFALNLIQYSDQFVPGLVNCPDGPCVEEAHPWLIWIWVMLIALILILPFWGILMLIRCKLQLDNWLEYSLAGLNQKRRLIMEAAAPLSGSGTAASAGGATSKGGKNETTSTSNLASFFSLENSADKEQETHEETEKIVHQLVTTVLGYQEYLAGIWTAECGWLVRSSTAMLWMSVVAALLLTSMSIWIFLANKGGEHAVSGRFFLPMILSGCLAPGGYVILQHNSRKKVVPPPVFDDDGLIQEPFPLSTAHLRAASFKHLPSLHRQALNGQKLTPLAEMDLRQPPMRRSRSETDVATQRRMGGTAAPLAASAARRASAEKLPWWRCYRRRSTREEDAASMLRKPLVQDRG